MVYDSMSDQSYLTILNRFLHAGFMFSDCSSWISRSDTKCQNSWLHTCYKYILSKMQVGFQTMHFICNWVGCKHWLWSIQRHATHSILACCAHHHLKLLSCLIRTWADALLSAWSSWSAALHKIPFWTCCFVPMPYSHRISLRDQ